MLTCKSLFGLGYRGERLIEPLLNCMSCKVVKKDAEKAGLSEELFLPGVPCDIVKLPGHLVRPFLPSAPRKGCLTPRRKSWAW